MKALALRVQAWLRRGRERILGCRMMLPSTLCKMDWVTGLLARQQGDRER